MFEQIRRSFNELLDRATKPEDRREIVVRMKDTLVQARIGLDDLRDALQKTRRKLETEQKELATVRRRKELAVGINDAETIAVAERFEKQHGELVAILEQKLAVQEREVAVAEAEVEEMKAEIRKAMAATPYTPGSSSRAIPVEDPLVDREAERARQELDALERERTRAARDDDAARRLEELKRKMGK